MLFFPHSIILMICNSRKDLLFLLFFPHSPLLCLRRDTREEGSHLRKTNEKHTNHLCNILNSNIGFQFAFKQGQHTGFVSNIEQSHDNMDTFRSLGLNLCSQIIFGTAQFALLLGDLQFQYYLWKIFVFTACFNIQNSKTRTNQNKTI